MEESEKSTEHRLKEVEKNQQLVDELAGGFACMPILARLRYVANIIGAHAMPDDPMVDGPLPLCVADKVLRDVIDILRDHPQAANLDQPKPRCRQDCQPR